jgi:hypothetical protein
MESFILTIALLCGTDTADINDDNIHACHEYYINCGVVGAGEFDYKKLEQCANKRGDNFSKARSEAIKQRNQTDSNSR